MSEIKEAPDAPGRWWVTRKDGLSLGHLMRRDDDGDLYGAAVCPGDQWQNVDILETERDSALSDVERLKEQCQRDFKRAQTAEAAFSRVSNQYQQLAEVRDAETQSVYKLAEKLNDAEAELAKLRQQGKGEGDCEHDNNHYVNSVLATNYQEALKVADRLFQKCSSNPNPPYGHLLSLGKDNVVDGLQALATELSELGDAIDTVGDELGLREGDPRERLHYIKRRVLELEKSRDDLAEKLKESQRATQWHGDKWQRLAESGVLTQLDESTKDLVVTVGNINAEIRCSTDSNTAWRWEGVVDHLLDQIDANRRALEASRAT